MFKRLKKDKNTLIVIFFLETLFACVLIILSLALVDIPFVSKYSIYILLAYFLIVNFLNIYVIGKFLNRSERYLSRTDITIASIFGNEVSPVFEFGKIAILVYNEFDEIIWMSQTTLIKKEDVLGKKIFEIIPNFDELSNEENSEITYASLGGKTFQVEINLGLKVVYFKDVSAQVIQDAKMEAERLFIGHIVIDNYQDVVISLGEADFIIYVTEVKDAIMNWAKKHNLFIRSYNSDSFLIVGEESNYLSIAKDNFSIIEEVRGLAKENENPLTVSLGIGKGNTTSVLRTSELSYMALNMALSRGGDQAVINVFGKPLEYYGAKNEVKQTRSHVRGRVLATSLANLIKANKSVVIMGHKNLDFDALGACLGVYSICKTLKVKAYVVYDDEMTEYQTKKAFRKVFSNEELNEIIISSQKVLQLSGYQTLVVVVDTHRPDSTIQPKLLEKCKDICVIDHHRKGDVFISEPIFQYHEPQASSASELVTELIYYQSTKILLTENVANFLLAGICLDTKFFKAGSSSKTFEMAMVLKNNQASVEAVNEYFKEEYEEMKLISSIVNTSKAIFPGVYLAFSEDSDIITRTYLSKVAEEILSTQGVQAVFVVGRTNQTEVSVSARSLSAFNVQLIMESLGGGGHFSKAATQIQNTNVKQVIAMVEEKVRIFIRDGGKI